MRLLRRRGFAGATCGLAALILACAAGAQSLEWTRSIYGVQPSAHGIGVYWKARRTKLRDGRAAIPVRRGFGGNEYASVSVVDVATAARLWSTDLPEPCNALTDVPFFSAVDIAFAGNGDVIVGVAAGGYDPHAFQPKIGCIARLDAADGHVRWMHTDSPIDTQFGANGFTSVAVDGHDDVVAAGYASEDGSHANARVVKVSGSTGEVLWTFDDPSPAAGYAMAVDMAAMPDDAIAVATYRGPHFDDPGTARLIKIAEDGTPAWSLDRATRGFTRALAARDDGTLLWAHESEYYDPLYVSLVDTASGSLRWKREVRGTVADIASARSGPVYVAGQNEFAPYFEHDFLFGLSPSDGADTWRIALQQPSLDPAYYFTHIDVAEDGDVFAEIADRRTNDGDTSVPYLTAARFDAQSGATLWTVPIPEASAYERDGFLAVAAGTGTLVDLARRCWTWEFWATCDIRVDAIALANGAAASHAYETELARATISPPHVPWSDDQRRNADLSPSHDRFFVLGNSGGQINVVAVSAQSGDTIWTQGRRDRFGVHMTGAALATARNGDVLVAGTTSGIPPDFLTARLSGMDGSVIWRVQEHYDVAAHSEGPHDIAADPAGNALVAGIVDTRDEIVKYDGATGAAVWHAHLDDTGWSVHVRSDAAGNAVVVSRLSSGARVAKLAAADGHALWIRTISGTELTVNAMQIAANGDVLVVGDREAEVHRHVAFASRLRAADGSAAWTTENLGSPGPRTYATAALLATEQALIVGAGFGEDCDRSGCDDASSWLAARLDAATGALSWSVEVLAGQTAERITALSVGQGSVLAAGPCRTSTHCAAGLSMDSGAVLWSFAAGPALPGPILYGSYPTLVEYAGSGDVRMAGDMSFPMDFGEYDGWRVSRAIVPVVDALFADGFE